MVQIKSQNKKLNTKIVIETHTYLQTLEIALDESREGTAIILGEGDRVEKLYLWGFTSLDLSFGRWHVE